MVIFLSIHEIERVVAQLVKSYGEETPVAVVEKASWAEERKIIGTLRNIAGKVKEAGIKRHALIVVGEVLGKAYRRSKLYDADFEHGFRKKRNQ
jgi:precorrin-4/cobalt-precorrin-4 C11-methyltransferase